MMCWKTKNFIFKKLCCVSVAGCLGYDVLADFFGDIGDWFEFQLLVV
ncbi:hypothetical protein BSPWISOX_2013 [uncultured Gammaproteobacteria bacterium]|nr:hypothetical protein BSPWISOX_2013 [uncultured Gammaproteobacteria bacterium]